MRCFFFFIWKNCALYLVLRGMMPMACFSRSSEHSLSCHQVFQNGFSQLFLLKSRQTRFLPSPHLTFGFLCTTQLFMSLVASHCDSFWLRDTLNTDRKTVDNRSWWIVPGWYKSGKTLKKFSLPSSLSLPVSISISLTRTQFSCWVLLLFIICWSKFTSSFAQNIGWTEALLLELWVKITDLSLYSR